MTIISGKPNFVQELKNQLSNFQSVLQKSGQMVRLEVSRICVENGKSYQKTFWAKLVDLKILYKKGLKIFFPGVNVSEILQF